MGRIIAYIIAVLFALIAGLILFLFIAVDVIKTKEYMKANRTSGVVRRDAGEEDFANYGKLQPPTKYWKYLVDYQVDGKMYSGIFLCGKDEKYDVGTDVEVRYVIDKDGIPEIVNSEYKDRLFRLIFVVILAIPFSVFCFYVSKRWD